MTCKYMNWDWNTYMKQPAFFIETINTLRILEAEEIDKQNKKINRK